MAYLSRQGTALLIWIVVLTVVCAVVLTLRYWAARITKRPWQPDDYMVIFAFINTITLSSVSIWAIVNGLGGLSTELTPAQIGVQFRLIISAGVTWLLGTVFVKLAVIWLYMRIFTTKAFRFWGWMAIGLCVAYGIGFFVTFMTACIPVDFPWNLQPGGSCRDLTLQEIASVSCNIFVDVVIIVLPMPSLWGLQMPIRNKIFITLMFCIGFATLGTMAYRLHITLYHARNQTDFVYSLYDIGLLSHLELWLGIIVACIPTLAPLMNKYVKPVVSKLSWSSKRNDSSGPRVPQYTFGGGSNKQASARAYRSGVNESGFELDDGPLSQNVARTGTAHSDAQRSWLNNSPEPGIQVRHDIDVDYHTNNR